jgi:hypothetical protein
MDILNRKWTTAAVERMIKTFCQVLLVFIADDTLNLGLVDVEWAKALSVAGLAALASLLTSVASTPLGPAGSPSLTHER